MESAIEIVETVGTGPIRFLTDKSSKIEIGSIVELTEINGNPCCKLSDGTKPFGVVTEIGGPFGMVTMHFDTMVLRTKNFDMEHSYLPGDFVYSSNIGKFTTSKPHENSHIIGHVVLGAGVDRDFVEINWI